MDNVCRICDAPIFGKTELVKKLCRECRNRARKDPSVKYPRLKPIRKGWVEDGVGYVPLTKGMVAIVDPEDLENITQWNWYARWSPFTKSDYGQRTDTSCSPFKTTHMHRVILGLTTEKVQVDHINHDTLDNRKENLRMVTPGQNCRNRKIGKMNRTGFKGVSRTKTKIVRYAAHINFFGEERSLGIFDTPEEAHAAYIKAATELDPDFVCAG